MTPNCECQPYDPVLPTGRCSGSAWLGFKKMVHVVGLDYLDTYFDDGAVPLRFNAAETDLWVSASILVEGLSGTGSQTPALVELSLHSSAVGANQKVISSDSTELLYEYTSRWLTVQGFIPKGAFWSLRVNDADLAQSAIFYQVGARQ